MRILIVDDEPMTLLAIGDYLRRKGYAVSTADNIVDALKLLNEQKIDLVISDIAMPNISGFTFLSMLKNFYFNRVPVFLISAYHDENIMLEARSLGAAEFIIKPIDFDELSSKIEKYRKTQYNA